MKKALAFVILAAFYLAIFWAMPIFVGGSWLPWWGHVLMIHGMAVAVGVTMGLAIWAGNTLLGGKK